MDLVEIRKKAKKPRKKPAKKRVAAAEPDVVETSAPEQAPVEPQAAPEPPTAAEAVTPTTREQAPAPDAAPARVEVDPLEALFAFRVEGDLATEETYLKALMGDEELADGDIQQWLTFSLGEEEYALDIEAVNEIIKPREVTDIPRVPEFIRGIISLRGIIVPVIDLRGRLNLGAVESGSTARIIVCQQEEKLAGFLVDRINHVVNVPKGQIEPPPTVLSGLDRDFVEGVGRVDGRMLILLHLASVINTELV